MCCSPVLMLAAGALAVSGSLAAAATTHYVAPTGGNTFPYDSWAKAARSPSNAVAACSSGDTVLIAPGTYMGTLTVNRSILVQGTAAGAVINGNGKQGVRILNAGAVVSNLEITGSREWMGGGLGVEGGTAQDCRIYGNRAWSNGGGVYVTSHGIVRRCEIYSNISEGNGGGVWCFGGTVVDCSIHDNQAATIGGGAMMQGTMENCIVYDNTAVEGGGILNTSTTRMCRVYRNTAARGAGISSYASVSRCWVSYNSGQSCKGAGILMYPGSSTVNCIIDFNTAYSGFGGGVLLNGGGTCSQCTIVNNEVSGVFPSGGLGGGVCVLTNGIVRNSIIYYNTGPSGANNLFTSGSPVISANCTTPAVGTSAVTAAPAFVNLLQRNYRLTVQSPCVDAVGSSAVEDFDGGRRPLDGNFDGITTSDIGAFERGHVPPNADYDGDGATDLAVYVPSTCAWYIRSLRRGVLAYQMVGGPADSSATRGDYDGLGSSPVVTFKGGNWLRRSIGSSLAVAVNWGFPGCVPVAGDYDGDGYSDFAVFYPPTGEWYIRSGRSNATMVWAKKWGFSGCVPVPGDYDGDGKFDMALYNPSSALWYIGSLTRGVLAMGANWGFSGCTPVPGDFNGDGRSDLAVFNGALGSWYIKSLDGTVLSMGTNWGFAGCKAVSGDFDADCKYDLAVYSQATGSWYIRSLLGGVIAYGQQWGWSAADPVQ